MDGASAGHRLQREQALCPEGQEKPEEELGSSLREETVPARESRSS